MSDEKPKNEINKLENTDENDQTTSKAEEEKKASSLDAELVESLEELPPEARRGIIASLSSLEITSSTRNRSSLVEKFNDEHIHKYLDYVQRDDDNAFELQKTNRYFQLAYISIAVFVLVFGVVFLVDRDRELLMFLIQFLVALAGGVGFGYGWSRKD